MKEHERQLEVLRHAVASLIDEPILAAQMAYRGGYLGDDGLRALRAVRRWTARGDHPADRASARLILVVTPIHLVALRARHARQLPPVTPTGLLAYWAHDACDARPTDHTAASYMATTGSTTHTKIRRLDVRWPGDDRGVAFDLLAADRLTAHFLTALHDARVAARRG